MCSASVGNAAGSRQALPARLTTFVGRERELAELVHLSETCRLMTLTGPGGCGKTRLALELADRLALTYVHDVYVVSLATLSDPTLVMSTIAEIVGVRETPGEPIAETLARVIGERRLLLVLDNFEHLLSAGPTIADLLAACPRLLAIVTSRELLRLDGEQVFPVRPLTLPLTLSGQADARVHPAVADVVSLVAASEAGRLFIERARNVQPEFHLDRATATAVAEICARVDGLPLAIELAAARVRLLSPRALVERLERRLPLLTDGPRDLPSRQHTLRATITWSYDLLTEAEQDTFRRLAVFVGGCTLPAAAAVCGDREGGGSEPLDVIASLVDKSLLRQTEDSDGEPRFGMLETIREYALERLAESGELAGIRRRHAEYFRRLAEEAAPHLERDGSAAWFDRLQADHDNLRAALTWSGEADGDHEIFARLVGHLWWFWWLRGHWSEAQRWLGLALGLTTTSSIRLEVLAGAGTLAHFQGDLRRAEAAWSEAVTLAQHDRDEENLAQALSRLGYAVSEMGDHKRALTLCREGLELARRLGDPNTLAEAYLNLGHAARNRGDDDEAVASWEACLRIDREAGFARRLPTCLQMLAIVATRRSEFDRATALCEQALDLYQQRGVLWGIVSTSRRLERIAQLKGEPASVAALALKVLLLSRQLDSLRTLRPSLVSLSWVARVGGDPERSTRLLGAAETVGGALALRHPTIEHGELETEIALLRAALGEQTFASALAAGRALTSDQAYALAIETASLTVADARPADAPSGQRDAQVGGLSQREREVATLVAEGLSNPQIAVRLGLSDRTIDAHLRNIMGKLDVTSRAQVAAWSVRHGHG